MQYFDIVKDKIYHKKTGELIVDLRTIDYFWEGENGCLIIREKGCSFDNLVYDIRGNKLPYTGNKNIEVFLDKNVYVVKTPKNKDDCLSFSRFGIPVIENVYPYPYRETSSFSILYDEKSELFNIYLKEKGFITSCKNYHLYTSINGEYIQVDNGLDDEKKVFDSNGTIVSLENNDNFFIGGRLCDLQESSKSKICKKKLSHLLTPLFFMGVLFSLVSDPLDLKYNENNKEEFENQKISYIGMGRVVFENNIHDVFLFDKDNDYATSELMAFADKKKHLQLFLDAKKFQPMTISKWKSFKDFKHVDFFIDRTKL